MTSRQVKDLVVTHYHFKKIIFTMPSTFKAIVFRVLVLHVILRNALRRGKCDFVCQKKIHLKNCSCICFLTLKYVSSIEMSWLWNDSFIEKFSLTFGLSSTLEREKKSDGSEMIENDSKF